MNAQELADQTGLSLEEAEMVLRRREERAVEARIGRPMSRLEHALHALSLVEKKVGVRPYEESK